MLEKVYCNLCNIPITLKEEHKISDTNDLYVKCPSCECVNHYNVTQEILKEAIFGK